MSQQLGFILKYNKNPEIKVDLSWFSTTPARTLSCEGIFPYSEDDVLLNKEIFNEYISLINENIQEYVSFRDKCVKERNQYNDLIVKATTKESAKALIEEKDELQSRINSWQEEIDEWENYKTIICLMKSYMEDNEEEWSMYYYNC